MERAMNQSLESHGRDLSQEHAVRCQKVTQLQSMGIPVWSVARDVTATLNQVENAFSAAEQQSKVLEDVFCVAGRVVTLRDHGKSFFGHLQDRSGRLQFYLKADVVGDESFNRFKSYVDLGDIIWLQGTAFRTKKGEITLQVAAWQLLSKCLHPLPEKYHGLTDVEQRYRQRYLDLMSNQESQHKFRLRSYIVQSIRQFLLDHDFLEVETPMLQPIPGGAAAKPFITHHNAYDMELYLRIAPELYLKRLVIGGFERVFEINRNFRNEGISTRHNPEFTMLEFYCAHGDYKLGMDLTEQLLRHAIKKNFSTLQLSYGDSLIDFAQPFARLTLEESLIKIGGLSADDLLEKNLDVTLKKHQVVLPGKPERGMKLFGLFEACVEKKIVQPTFITGYPVEVSPLAQRDEQNPEVTARAELFIVGMEFANLFSELNDPFDQAERFKQQAQAKAAGDEEAHTYDADFVRALEYGMPPTVGVGIGIDRLTMLLTNTSSIKDVILFPTLKRATDLL